MEFFFGMQRHAVQDGSGNMRRRRRLIDPRLLLVQSPRAESARAQAGRHHPHRHAPGASYDRHMALHFFRQNQCWWYMAHKTHVIF